jgi:hypothetical protein
MRATRAWEQSAMPSGVGLSDSTVGGDGKAAPVRHLIKRNRRSEPGVGGDDQ